MTVASKLLRDLLSPLKGPIVGVRRSLPVKPEPRGLGLLSILG